MRLHSLLCIAVLALAGCGGRVSQAPASSPAEPPNSGTGSPAQAQSTASATLFTMTNASSGNEVVQFQRGGDGTISRIGTVPAGGSGVGRGLENQGALAFSRDRKVLLVVNPGTDDVSSFILVNGSLTLAGRASSGGRLPVSVTSYKNLVYVLNRGSEAGDPAGDTISGLSLEASGSLAPIRGSTQHLSAPSTNAAQISFTPDGRNLVVTEHGAGNIDVFNVDSAGVASNRNTQSSAGAGPFGFELRNSFLYVSEASGGTASAYNLDANGNLTAISGALATEQNTACWLNLSHDGRFAFVANTLSGSISTFQILNDGGLKLLNSIAARTNGGPLDMAISSDDLYLNVLTTAGNIQVFRVDTASGGLTLLQTIGGLPPGTNGLASL